jgi:hypothetical protein
MEKLTLNQLFNSLVSFDPGTIYATVDDNTFKLQWDNERECFIDEYREYHFSENTVYNAPIVRIDSRQGYGNTLYVIVKL